MVKLLDFKPPTFVRTGTVTVTGEPAFGLSRRPGESRALFTLGQQYAVTGELDDPDALTDAAAAATDVGSVGFDALSGVHKPSPAGAVANPV